MAGIVLNGSVYRIRQCALDLLSIVDLMDDEVSWDITERDFQLRSTFLYLKLKDSTLMESRYFDTAKVLEELMALLPYCDPFVEDESDD
ncbi:hypothetical protein MKX03_024648 [Papaver bracteatum]|nr:hypothetical protein MKX03_024648 [Papaver bracteatum]